MNGGGEGGTLLPLNAGTPKARMAGGRRGRGTADRRAGHLRARGRRLRGRQDREHVREVRGERDNVGPLSLSHCETRAIYQPSLLLLLFVEGSFGPPSAAVTLIASWLTSGEP